MGFTRHVFDTTTEANAFKAGVEHVNDGAIEVVDIEVGEDEHGPRSTVVLDDDDADEDSETEYRLVTGNKP